MVAAGKKKGLLSSNPFKFYWLRVNHRRRPFWPTNTAFLAMEIVMLCLIVHLLPRWPTSGKCAIGGIIHFQLPWAKGIDDLIQAPGILVRDNVITIDGYRVATFEQALSCKGLFLRELAGVLGNLQKNHSILHPGQTMRAGPIIWADRNTPFGILKKIVHTCLAAGYPPVQFAVMREHWVGCE